MPKRISLTQGQFALVDDEWYDELAQWNWRAQWCKGANSFYAVRHVRRPDGKWTTEYMHRRITGFHWARVDHENHDTLDNRVQNLRDGSGSKNNRNLRRRPVGSTTSIYHGVSWSTRYARWQVQIRANNRRIFLGRFDDEIEAALAYDRASRELHGEYGTRNFGEEVRDAPRVQTQ